MSRAAIFYILSHDATLNNRGFTKDSIYHNWQLEERPNDGPFMLLMWGNEDPPPFQDEPVRSPMRLSLWIHFPFEMDNIDYVDLQKTLDDVDACFVGARDVVGEDDYTLSFVRRVGRSGDFKDDGFNTKSKNAGYEIYYR